MNGSTVSWSGGRLTGRTTVDFPVTITARSAPAPSLSAAQSYDDGATVKWNAGLSVLPATGAAAPKQHPWGALSPPSQGCS